MRFMIIRRADTETEAGVMPGAALIVAMAQYNEQLVKAGILLDGEGLQPTSKGARVKFSNGTPQVIDGPFTEAKELVAGFTMIDVRSRDEAIEWAKRWPTLDGHGEVDLEIRQVFELADFGTSPALDRHRRVGEQIAEQKARRVAPDE